MDRFGTLPSDGAQIGYNSFTRDEAVRAGVYENSAPVEDADDPFAGQDIEETVMVQAFRRVWDIEDQAFGPLKNGIRAAWDLYHRTWQSTPKDDDQTDRRYPLMMMYVEKICAAIMAMINFKDKWLDIKSTIPQHQVMMNVARNLSEDLLQHTDVKFVKKISEAVKSGIMTGMMITQVLPSQDKIASATGAPAAATAEELNGFLESFADLKGEGKPIVPNPLMPKVELRNVPTEQVRLDSTGCNRYWMWTQEVPVGTVFAEAEARDYDLEEIKLARDRKTWGKPADTTSGTETARKGMGIDGIPPKGMMRLHFFEGTLDDPETGLRIFTDKLCVMANGCRILLLTDIPFWDGERSAIISKFIDPPHSVYGKGLGVENVDSFDVRNSMTNLLLDFVRRVLNPPYEENVDMLDPEEARKGRRFFPGAVIKKQDCPPGGMVYTPVAPPDMPASFWNTYQALDLQSQSTQGLDTGIGGALRTRGRQTADEYNSRDAQQGMFFKNIFLLMEQDYLSPLVKTIYLRHLQYVTDETWNAWVKANKKKFLEGTDQSNPKVIAAWNQVFDVMATWEAEKRMKFFGGNISFNVQVFSQNFERQAAIEKVFFAMKNLAAVPGAVQYMKLRNWVRKGTEAFGWDPEEMLNPEALPMPDLEGITIPSQDDSAPETPDLSQGGRGVLESVAQEGMQPPATGIFPGGPTGPAPNQVGPPPM